MSEDLDSVTFETRASDGCRLRHTVEFGHEWARLVPEDAWAWVSETMTAWRIDATKWHDETYAHTTEHEKTMGTQDFVQSDVEPVSTPEPNASIVQGAGSTYSVRIPGITTVEEWSGRFVDTLLCLHGVSTVTRLEPNPLPTWTLMAGLHGTQFGCTCIADYVKSSPPVKFGPPPTIVIEEV